jgi:ADP-ribose pyrophosphatase YjhB (NUDIX family)
MVFRCQVTSLKDLKYGDDAKAVKVVPLKDALNLPLAFDHKKILTDYTRKFHPDLLPN